MLTCLEEMNARAERGEVPLPPGQHLYERLSSLRDYDGMRWCSNCHIVWDAVFPQSERFDMSIPEVRALYPCSMV